MRNVVMALLVLVGPASVVHAEQMQWAGCTANLLEGYHDQPRPCIDCTIGEIVGPKVAIQYYDSNFVSFLDPHGPDILWLQEPHMAGDWRVQFALRSTKDGEVLEMVMGGRTGFSRSSFTAPVKDKEDVAEVLLTVSQFACHR